MKAADEEEVEGDAGQWLTCADRAPERPAVDVRHGDVEQHDVRREGLDARDDERRVGEVLHLVLVTGHRSLPGAASWRAGEPDRVDENTFPLHRVFNRSVRHFRLAGQGFADFARLRRGSSDQQRRLSQSDCRGSQ